MRNVQRGLPTYIFILNYLPELEGSLNWQLFDGLCYNTAIPAYLIDIGWGEKPGKEKRE